MNVPDSMCQPCNMKRQICIVKRDSGRCNTVLPHIKDRTFEKYKLFLPVHLQIP